MDDIKPIGAAIPPQIPPATPSWSGIQPLGDNPEDREPIPSVVAAVEAILRHPRRLMYQFRQPFSGRLIGGMVAVAILCSLIYGVVVGTFSMGDQLWAAPVKMAGGLLISALICLPSLYVFDCLGGNDVRFHTIAGALAAGVCLNALLLIGLAPVAWIFSQSTDSTAFMGALHLLFWLIGLSFGLRLIGATSRFRSKQGRGHLKSWGVGSDSLW